MFKQSRTYLVSKKPCAHSREVAYPFVDDTLVEQVLADSLDQLYLFFRCQSRNHGFNHTSEGYFVDCDEAVVVHVGEEPHDELAIHAIGDASMPGNGIAKVLELECSLQSRCEETTKRSNERGKGCHDNNVKLYGSNGKGAPGRETIERRRNGVDMRNEDGVRDAEEDTRGRRGRRGGGRRGDNRVRVRTRTSLERPYAQGLHGNGEGIVVELVTKKKLDIIATEDAHGPHTY